MPARRSGPCPRMRRCPIDLVLIAAMGRSYIAAMGRSYIAAMGRSYITRTWAARTGDWQPLQRR